MTIPESIRQHKPTGFGAVEIRALGGNFYVYLISSKWNAAKKRPQKITGKSIGKITEADGFIANANGMRLMQELRLVPDTAPTVRNYGAYETLQQISPDLEAQLKKFFPDLFREIRTLALLRLVDSVSPKLVRSAFLASYMSDLCPDIASSDAAVRKLIASLGAMQNRIDMFMRDSILPGASLIFDGTSFFVRMSDSLGAVGYNPCHSLNPQIRVLYIFDKDSKRPVFYKILQGSVVDKSAFIDTVRDAGCHDCVIIADKGFYSKRNVSALMEAQIRFILPLQDNTRNVEEKFYENLDDHKFDGLFSYKGRAIFYRKKRSGSEGNWIYTFRDNTRRDEMLARFVEKTEKEYGEEEQKPMDVLKQPRLGYFSFCSNIDEPAKEIYLAYKERWDIEECFDYLKNSVVPGASYARNDDYFRGWAFLNHMSLLYYYGLLKALSIAKLNDSYSADDVLKLTKNIYRVDSGDERGFCVSAVQKKTQTLLDSLGVDLLRKNRC